MEKAKNPWSLPVVVEDIPETGLHIDAEAPAEVRPQLAKLAGLRSLPRISGTFDLMRQGAGVRIAGRVNARVGQICVVTLEPIESDLEEPVDLVFAPAAASETADHGSADGKTSDKDPPEPLIDGRLDLGAVATEFLLLGIDPYPRKAGAQFGALKSDDDIARPFAALEALKKRMGDS